MGEQQFWAKANDQIHEVFRLQAENARLRNDLTAIRDFAQACWGADYYTYEEYGDIATMASEALGAGLREQWWSVPVIPE